MGLRLTSVLQDLRDRYGLTMADLTTDEVEMLVHACDRLENPYSQINAELMERPIRLCDGVYLWPVTAGAHVWLTEFASKWWDEKSAFFKWVQAFALINARNPDAFSGLTSKGKAFMAVTACALRLACHIREIGRAVAQAYGVEQYEIPKKDKVRESAKNDFASLVARLEVSSGIPKDKWLWGRSVRSMMKSYVELSELSVAALGGNRKEATTELDEAVENMARACASIVERIGRK